MDSGAQGSKNVESGLTGNQSICLVQPPLLFEGTSELMPPLGLLTLAAVLRDNGHSVKIVDLNLLSCQNKHWVQGKSFFKDAVNLILECKPEFVGFTSMAIDSHTSLKLANEVKLQKPEIKTILGGPHFSAIALDVLDRFEWIDYVVCGEGEKPVIRLLNRTNVDGRIRLIKNVAERTVFGAQVLRDATDRVELANAPFPAYDLINLQDYFSVNPHHRFAYEHARGCNLRCSFCYSPGHWGQGENFKPEEKVTDELLQLKRMGAKSIFFIADNFLNDKTQAIKLANAIEHSGVNIRWQCYATLAQLTPRVIGALAKARCVGVFIGIDAVSEESKKAYKKQYYKGWDSLKKKLRNCIDRGIEPTCALMLSPEMERDEVECVLNLVLYIFSIGGFVRLNHLSMYNGTAISLNTKKSKMYYSDFQVLNITDSPRINTQNEYAENYPELFPFHCRYTTSEAEREIVLVNKICYVLVQLYPKTLLRYVFQHGGIILDIVDYCSKHYINDYSRTLEQEFEHVSGSFKTCPDILERVDLCQIVKFESMRHENKELMLYPRRVLNTNNKVNYNFIPRLEAELPCNPKQLGFIGSLSTYGDTSHYYVSPNGDDFGWFETNDSLVEKIVALEKAGLAALDIDEEIRLQLSQVIFH